VVVAFGALSVGMLRSNIPFVDLRSWNLGSLQNLTVTYASKALRHRNQLLDQISSMIFSFPRSWVGLPHSSNEKYRCIQNWGQAPAVQFVRWTLHHMRTCPPATAVTLSATCSTSLIPMASGILPLGRVWADPLSTPAVLTKAPQPAVVATHAAPPLATAPHISPPLSVCLDSLLLSNGC
jgi:hypothetical protein